MVQIRDSTMVPRRANASVWATNPFGWMSTCRSTRRSHWAKGRSQGGVAFRETALHVPQEAIAMEDGSALFCFPNLRIKGSV